MAELGGMYPNELVSDETKDTPLYGMSVGKYIEGQWFGSDNRYKTRLGKFEDLRSQMKGDIDMTDMFDILGLDPDKSKESIDYSPPRVVTKFVNDVADGFTTKVSKIKTYGTDPVSNQMKQDYSESLKKFMTTSGFSKRMDQAMGTSLTPTVAVPEDDDEHELHMRFDYHTVHEMVAEDSIGKVMDINKWDLTEREIKEDLVLVGEGGVRVKRNGGQIVYERVLPENFIYSTDTNYASDRRGTFYFAHVRVMTVGEFKRYASSRGEEPTDEYIRSILGGTKDYVSKGSTNGSDYGNRNYEDDQMTITVLDFAYKTSRHITKKKRYNKKGGYSLIDKESSFKANSKGKYESIQSSYEVWYEGLYPIGAPNVVGYRLMDNMPRKRSNLRDSFPPFIYFTLSSESIGSRILPYAKQLNINFIKIQQHIAKMRPDGAAVDISALADIEISDGKILKPEEIIKEFNISGNLLYDGEKLEGEYGNKREPIRDNPAVNSDKIGQLIRAYLHNIQQIRDETGIANTSNPDPKALIGMQKIAMANTQVSIRHISDGMFSIIQRLAETTLMHLQMMARYNVHSDQLMNAIGSFNATAIEDFAKIGNFEYDTIVELEPEEEEKITFREDLQMALKAGNITLDEKIDIERYKRNLDYASQLLKLRIKKRRKQAQEDQQRQAQMMQQIEQQKTQNEIIRQQQVAAVEIEKQKAIIAMETKSKMDLAEHEMLLKQQYGNPELTEKKDLETFRTDQRMREEKQKDDRKDERLDKQSTQNSKMIEQRKQDKGPIDFESTSKLSDIVG